MRGPSEIYRQSYWFRLVLKLWVPGATALVAAIYASLARWGGSDGWGATVRDSPLWLVTALVAAAANPLAAFFSKKWDDELKDRNAQELETAHQLIGDSKRESDAWQYMARLYVDLNGIINELVLDKSNNYLDVLKDSQARQDLRVIADGLESRDTFQSNSKRIAQTLYRFLQKYSDRAVGHEFQVVLLNVDDAKEELVLGAYFNTRDQPPRSFENGASNPHFKKDGDSLASLAWRRGEMVIISDTVEELKEPNPRFARIRHGEENEIRSIVCYPVIDRGFSALGSSGDIGILCAHSNSPNVFTCESPDLEVILETFANRIIFELRRQVCERLSRKVRSI